MSNNIASVFRKPNGDRRSVVEWDVKMRLVHDGNGNHFEFEVPAVAMTAQAMLDIVEAFRTAVVRAAFIEAVVE